MYVLVHEKMRSDNDDNDDDNDNDNNDDDNDYDRWNARERLNIPAICS